ncbi:MAG: urease accessory protein UreF [Rhizobiaceae bacterium]|nr:urease accessory protein UreF [Rhizobiaceae bacterium]MCV0405142.1 urease accessory protein UreF [Rhizobiaceae bacterium]
MATRRAKRTGSGACPAIRITVMTMPEAATGQTLLRLMAWLSPAFPVGSFSYSHGLERAVHDSLVSNAVELRDWLGALIEYGSAWNDAVLFCEATRRAEAGGDLAELAELAEALAGSVERHMESTLQGRAFMEAAGAWPNQVLSLLPENCPYCIAVGALVGAMGLPRVQAAAAFLQAFSSNLVQAAIRLGVTGQSDGVKTLASLEALIAGTAGRAARSSLDDLGSVALISEIAAMRHETQYSRLFRT